MKKIGVLRFPGTNCDYDVFNAINELGLKAQWLWHQDHFVASEFEGYVIPGGFSYGDYLRCGAMAARSPVMDSLREADKLGKPILGICNGFQILCEAKLLPGALLRNAGLRFIDDWVELKTEKGSSIWNLGESQLKLPIAHGEGRYFHPNPSELFDKEQVFVTYVQNPNGSLNDIAGVLNKNKNVAALMPHPERAIQDWMGGSDGRRLLNVFQ